MPDVQENSSRPATVTLTTQMSATDVPPLRLAGTEDDEDDLIIVRGID
jgi:hypothetical protein